MIKSPAKSLALQCGTCRLLCVKSFAASTAISIRSHFQPTCSIPSVVRFAPKETFQTSALCHSDLVSQSKDDSTIGTLEGSEAKREAPQETDLEPSPITPWYLQVNRLQHVTEPLSNQSRLPALPENPPPLLQPALEYMSVDLGLDALSILDLRKLDPPPGLGVNLIMVLATSRSEKHLHVSADRLCKWLRYSHKLSPYADGLMGRGEIKIKLRRKARRAKLLRSVGSSESTNMDDGISSGWICVNVGRIESGENALELTQELEHFVGFSSQVKVEETTLVIQMMTVGRREELDLEELWGKALARHERKQARISKPFGEE